MQVGRAVDARGLVDGGGDRIKVALLHQIPHRRGARVEEDQRLQAVEQPQLRHDDVDGGHAHETGKHAQHQRQVLDCVAPLEAEAAHHIAGQDDQHRAENAAHGRDVEGVKEPLAVGIQAVHIIGKEVDEGLQAVFRREEAVNLVQAARFAQRGQNQPQAGEQKDQGNDGQRQIGEPIVHGAAQRQLSFSGIGRHGVCAH